jgi:hypothetical protein
MAAAAWEQRMYRLEAGPPLPESERLSDELLQIAHAGYLELNNV